MTGSGPWKIVSLDPRRLDEACAVMVSADMNLLPLRHAAPDRVGDLALRTWFNRAFLRYGLRYGEVHCTPEIEGLAIWLPPGRGPLSLLRLLRVGFHQLPLRLGVRATRRMLELARITSARHVSSVEVRHWYLFNIAVAPDLHGRGIGSALLRPVLARADEAGLECYLEARDAAGTAFYQRHGFEAVPGAPLRVGDFEVWPMRRPRSPRRPTTHSKA